MALFPTNSEEAIFLAALEKGSRRERECYLAEACRGNASLAARIRELLAAHDGDSGPLDATLPGAAASTQREAIERPGTQIGPYKLLQVIGEGGMGVVYMASQREPVERRVALKIIKPGMDSRQVIARFEAERQALALMDHPNIARVLDGGTVDGSRHTPCAVTGNERSTPGDGTRSVPATLGRPYFVMELVKGVPITQYCDEHHLTPRQRLELFIPVCQAIQHAHQKGIIHRDVKPTNILVAEYDQQPVPKIIDFGVAKAIGQRLTEKTMFTEFGQVVGTIEYMSPEQAKLNQLDIDTRTDIYSLGVLLYELLSGETPFDKQRLRSAAFDEVLRIIREEEPPRPSTRLSSSHSLPTIAASRHTEPRQLTSQLRGELDWIVMKALEKDRNRRYETASGLAMDLLRFLRDEPVLACPPSAGYRLGKFARRNKRTLVTTGLFTVLLIGAITAIASIGGWAVRDGVAQRAAAAQRIALDRAERSAVLTQEIEAALGEVALAYSHDRLGDAQAAQKRAASLWASGSDDLALQKRIEQWRADLQLAQRLDEIRLEQAAVKDGHFDRGAAEPAYREAFTQYGLDFDRGSPAALAGRIRAAAIRDRLVPALDEWLESRLSVQLPGAEVLVAVAALADADPWRNRLRQASLKHNPQELLALAQEADMVEHPATSLLLLASLLRGSGQMQPAIELLEQAQQHYPVDFWINQNLGLYLMQLQAPQVEKALGYYRAAVTLRPSSPGVRLNLGNALRRLRRYAEAERAYRVAVELKPDYAEAHAALGLVLTDQERLDEAERAFSRAVELRPNYPRAVANLGSIYLTQDRLAESEFCCRAATLLDPDDAYAQRILGDLLLKLDRYEEAEAAYREVVRLDPRSGFPHQAVGTALRLQGKLNEAAAEFQLALRLDPRLGQSQSNLAETQNAARAPAAIEVQLRANLSKDPANNSVRMQLADFLASQGSQAAAEAEYREILKRAPEYAVARYKVVSTLSNQGRYAELEEDFQRWLRARPADAQLQVDFGFFLNGRNRQTEAEAVFRTAIRLDAKLPAPHFLLAKLLLGQKKTDEALAEFQAAVACDPNLAAPHAEYAAGLVQLGRSSEAIGEFREAVRLNPSDTIPRLNLADLLAKYGPPSEAEAEYREVLRRSSGYTNARRKFGEFLVSQNRLAEAETEFRHAVRQAPAQLDSRRSLLNLLLKQNRRDEALVVYQDAVRQLPNDLYRYRELAEFLEAEGRADEAEQVLRDAVAALPESSAPRDLLVTLLARRGKAAGAAEELQPLVRQSPQDPALQHRLARALKEQGKLQDAAAAALEAIRLAPEDVSHRFLLADVRAAQGQTAEEAAVLRQLIVVRPTDVGANQRLAGALQRLGQPDEAEAVFREAIRLNPTSLPLRQNLASHFSTRNKFADATEAWRDALRLAPSDAGSHVSLAYALNVQGLSAEAFEVCRRALALNPELHSAHAALARFLEAQGKLPEALAEARLAASAMPEDGYSQSLLGNLLLKSALFTEAEQVLLVAQRLRPNDVPTKNDLAQVRQKLKATEDVEVAAAAVREKPTDPAAQFRLGNLLRTLGRLDDAEAALNEAVRLSPEAVPHRQALASLLSFRSKVTEEEAHRRELVRLLPKDARAHYYMGNVHARVGRWRPALEEFELAAELDPNFHWNLYGVTVLRLELGDLEGYREASRQMLDRFEKDPLPDVLDRTAKTCLMTADGAGELARAQALAEKAVTGTEKNTYYWYFQFGKGLAEYRAGNDAQAVVWLDKFLARSQSFSVRQATYAPFYASGHAVTALAQHRLKRSAEAAAALATAQALLKQWMAAGTAEQPLGMDWDDWLRARMLVREAEQALTASPAASQEAPR